MTWAYRLDASMHGPTSTVTLASVYPYVWLKRRSVFIRLQHAASCINIHQKNAMRRVVVTGLGLVTPLGIGDASKARVGVAFADSIQVSAEHGNASLRGTAASCPSQIGVPILTHYQAR
jgi:hypothetical protein